MGCKKKSMKAGNCRCIYLTHVVQGLPDRIQERHLEKGKSKKKNGSGRRFRPGKSHSHEKARYADELGWTGKSQAGPVRKGVALKTTHSESRSSCSGGVQSCNTRPPIKGAPGAMRPKRKPRRGYGAHGYIEPTSRKTSKEKKKNLHAELREICDPSRTIWGM